MTHVDFILFQQPLYVGSRNYLKFSVYSRGLFIAGLFMHPTTRCCRLQIQSGILLTFNHVCKCAGAMPVLVIAGLLQGHLLDVSLARCRTAPEPHTQPIPICCTSNTHDPLNCSETVFGASNTVWRTIEFIVSMTVADGLPPTIRTATWWPLLNHHVTI